MAPGILVDRFPAAAIAVTGVTESRIDLEDLLGARISVSAPPIGELAQRHCDGECSLDAGLRPWAFIAENV